MIHPEREGATVLPDGRVLAYTLRGDPEGVPVLEFHGLPSPRRAVTVPEAFLRERGILLVAVDRPGVGHSGAQQGRILADWPRDVRRLADHLGLGRFAVLGGSGGAPYALVCAWALWDRVSAVALVSGIGPLDRPGALRGMDPGERRMTLMSCRAPGPARLAAGFALGVDRLRPGTVLRGLLKTLPEADREVAGRPQVRRSLLESYALAFRQGAAGQVRDRAILARPWGFRVQDVQVPVRLFHGALDDRVPLHHAEHLAAELPDARLTVYPGEGHMIIFSRGETFLTALAGLARATQSA